MVERTGPMATKNATTHRRLVHATVGCLLRVDVLLTSCAVFALGHRNGDCTDQAMLYATLVYVVHEINSEHRSEEPPRSCTLIVVLTPAPHL